MSEHQKNSAISLQEAYNYITDWLAERGIKINGYGKKDTMIRLVRVVADNEGRRVETLWFDEAEKVRRTKMNDDVLTETDNARWREQEKERLNLAVDEWAEEMKERLFEKVDQNRFGWDDTSNKDIILQKLSKNLFAAINEMDFNGYTAYARRKFVHASNLAMFLGRFCDDEKE